MQAKHYRAATGSVISSGLAVLFATYCAYGTMEGDSLSGILELHAPEVVVGEPLVVSVGLKNMGPRAVITPFGRAGVFRHFANIHFTITKGDSIMRSVDEIRPSAVVYGIHPQWIASLGTKAGVIEPGLAVYAKRTLALLAQETGQRTWLKPGTYEVQAEIRLQGHAAPFRTSPERFTVKPLVPEQQGALSVFTADLAPLLEAGPDFSPQKVKEKVAELKKRFPQSPHRQYLDFHLLWAVPTREEKVAKANAYLKEFPKSPYVDDVLWTVARMEREADEYDKAAAHLETLLRDYPDSPLKQEAEEKLKEAQERATARKAAEEKEAVEEEAVPSQEKPAPAPDARP